MKNIIVTGTSRGIGLELAIKLADLGHQVLALSRKTSSIEQKKHKNIHFFSFDITLPEDLQKVTDFIDEKWGKVDILIHNAGKLINKPFLELTKSDFLDTYQVNVFGVVQLTQKVIPYMSEGAHVVMVSSMGGVQGSIKFAGLAAYSSSKGALITLSELLGEEFKNQGIAFNVLALGAVQTEMLQEAFPDYRTDMTAEQMAEYIAEFALNGNRFFNAKIIQVSNSTP